MIRVAIVDDHRILRNGVKQFLSEQVDLRVCGEASDGREALELVRNLEIDVLILDLCMPEHGGVDGLDAQSDKPRHELLSVREFQVFLRLAQGESVGGVAEHMCLSAKTISTYRSPGRSARRNCATWAARWAGLVRN